MSHVVLPKAPPFRAGLITQEKFVVAEQTLNRWSLRTSQKRDPLMTHEKLAARIVTEVVFALGAERSRLNLSLSVLERVAEMIADDEHERKPQELCVCGHKRSLHKSVPRNKRTDEHPWSGKCDECGCPGFSEHPDTYPPCASCRHPFQKHHFRHAPCTHACSLGCVLDATIKGHKQNCDGCGCNGYVDPRDDRALYQQTLKSAYGAGWWLCPGCYAYVVASKTVCPYCNVPFPAPQPGESQSANGAYGYVDPRDDRALYQQTLKSAYGAGWFDAKNNRPHAYREVQAVLDSVSLDLRRKCQYIARKHYSQATELSDTLLLDVAVEAAAMALQSAERTHCTLDNCGHMRQLDAIVDLLGMPRGGISVLDWLRRRDKEAHQGQSPNWTDDQVKAALNQLAEKVEEAENHASSIVSARDLTIRDLKAEIVHLKRQLATGEK